MLFWTGVDTGRGMENKMSLDCGKASVSLHHPAVGECLVMMGLFVDPFGDNHMSVTNSILNPTLGRVGHKITGPEVISRKKTWTRKLLNMC